MTAEGWHIGELRCLSRRVHRRAGDGRLALAADSSPCHARHEARRNGPGRERPGVTARRRTPRSASRLASPRLVSQEPDRIPAPIGGSCAIERKTVLETVAGRRHLESQANGEGGNWKSGRRRSMRLAAGHLGQPRDRRGIPDDRDHGKSCTGRCLHRIRRRRHQRVPRRSALERPVCVRSRRLPVRRRHDTRRDPRSGARGGRGRVRAYLEFPVIRCDTAIAARPGRRIGAAGTAFAGKEKEQDGRDDRTAGRRADHRPGRAA